MWNEVLLNLRAHFLDQIIEPLHEANVGLKLVFDSFVQALKGLGIMLSSEVSSIRSALFDKVSNRRLLDLLLSDHRLLQLLFLLSHLFEEAFFDVVGLRINWEGQGVVLIMLSSLLFGFILRK